MIQVTLNFTSLSAAVKALSEIPENLLAGGAPVLSLADSIADLKGEPRPDNQASAPAVTPGKPKAEKSPTPAPTPAAPAPTQPTAEAAQAAAPAPKAEPSAPVADEGPLEYAVLQKAVFTLAGKSRDAAAAINASFGVKTMKELPEAKRREALAAVNAKIAELGA